MLHVLTLLGRICQAMEDSFLGTWHTGETSNHNERFQPAVLEMTRCDVKKIRSSHGPTCAKQRSQATFAHDTRWRLTPVELEEVVRRAEESWKLKTAIQAMGMPWDWAVGGPAWDAYII